MERKTRLNARLEKILKHYRKMYAYEKSGYKGIKKADSSRSPIRITPKDLVNATGMVEKL